MRNYLKIIKDKLMNTTNDIFDRSSNFENIKTKLCIEDSITKFLEEKKYDVSLDELEDFKKKLDEQSVSLEIEQEGTMLWCITQLSQKIFKELKEEIIFLLRDLENFIKGNAKCVEII